jgi:Uma2 family endonuclease
MSVDQLDILRPAEQWEVEEPRPRRWSPVEFDFMVDSGLLPRDQAYLMGGRVLRERGGDLWRWTVDDYERMGELGLLGPEERVELIDGEVLEMSPQKSLHTGGVDKAARVFERAFGEGYYVRRQSPLTPAPTDAPEPDVAVVKGDIDDYLAGHPAEALLVLEVSDTSLRFDLGKKASRYAGCGVLDYWVTDIRNKRVHVLRDAVTDSSQRSGYRYSNVRSYLLGESISPLAAPHLSIAVKDLVPILPGDNHE